MKRKEELKMPRMLRWAAAFLLCLTMAVGFSVIRAQADETPSSVTEQWIISKTTEHGYYGPGRITFRNVRGDLTGLYVTKTVENESEDDPAPEGDTFSFLLKTGMSSESLSPCSGQAYTLRQDGKRVYNYSDGQTTEEVPGKMEDLLETDSEGRFTLKAGQTACFEGFVPGMQWEVTEEEKSGYELQSPTKATTSGVLTDEGAAVEYTNLYKRRYVPTPPPGKPDPDPDPETTSLTIKKTVSYPAFYEMPQTPEFFYSVYIGDQRLTKGAYTVYDTESRMAVETKEISEDENRRVVIKGGQYAVLEGLELAD